MRANTCVSFHMPLHLVQRSPPSLEPDASANCAYHGRIALSHEHVLGSCVSFNGRSAPHCPLSRIFWKAGPGCRMELIVCSATRGPSREAPQVHDRSKHDALDCELLNVVQDCFPFGAVALLPLLLEEFIDIRITPIGIGPPGVHERFHAGRGVAGTPIRRHENSAQLFSRQAV